MTAVDNRGVVLNLDNNEAEKLIKIFIHHPQLNDFTPRERRSHEVGDSSELFKRVEKLEDGLINACKITRTFIKHSEKNFKQIPKLIETERRNRENCLSLLNERISNSQCLWMDKFAELDDIIKTMSQKNVKVAEKPQTNNGGSCAVECSVVEDRGTSMSTTNMGDNFNTEEPAIANLSLGSGSTRPVSDNSFTWSDGNAVEEECDGKLNNSSSDSINDDEDTFQ